MMFQIEHLCPNPTPPPPQRFLKTTHNMETIVVTFPNQHPSSMTFTNQFPANNIFELSISVNHLRIFPKFANDNRTQNSLSEQLPLILMIHHPENLPLHHLNEQDHQQFIVLFPSMHNRPKIEAIYNYSNIIKIYWRYHPIDLTFLT